MPNLLGKLLIAPPSVKEGFWQKSVIVVTENFKGHTGLVLNKPSKMSIKEFARQNHIVLNIPGFIHLGGPVNTKALTMLHSNDWQCENTMQITDDFSISSSPEILTKLAMGHTPENWRMFIGLSGWTPGQLESEIAGDPPYTKNMSWLTATSDSNIIFDYNTQQQWTESIERSGVELVQKMLA
jgi:putative transcriptional regulator